VEGYTSPGAEPERCQALQAVQLMDGVAAEEERHGAAGFRCPTDRRGRECHRR